MSGQLEPEILNHLRDVLRALIPLLSTHGQVEKAEWLGERLATLDSREPDTVSQAVNELHRVVLGMGGLMDMHLRTAGGESDKPANAELRRLADQLYDLSG